MMKNPDKMRILFFNYEFPPLGGGAATNNYYLFREFARNDRLQIDCITSSENNVDEVCQFSDNIKLYKLNVGKKNVHFWTQREVLVYLWKGWLLSRRLVAANDYDLSHGFAGFPSGFLSWCFRKQVPYVISLLGSDVPGFNPRLRAQYKILAPLFRRIWRRSGAVIANSIGLRQLAREFDPSQEVSIIPGGVDVDEFFPGEAKERRAGNILCVSRLVERKGVHHLIEAMAEVAAEVPEATLTVVGSGDMEDRLKGLAERLHLQDHVRFLGYQPRESLPGLYREAEIFAQPSFFEGMSNTILGAMASGLPIVASGEGGREELFRGNAVHVPYGNPGVLAKTLVSLLRDGERIKLLGERSRELSMEFSWRTIAASYVREYSRVAGKAVHIDDKERK